MKSKTAAKYVQEHLNRGQPVVVDAVIEDAPAKIVKPKESKYPPIWQETIEELKAFFSTATLPSKIVLSRYEAIHRVPEFIEAHLMTVEANNGNPYFKPYLERLQRVKEILTNETDNSRTQKL